MDLASLKSWAGEQTTILGAMSVAGAAAGYLTGALSPHEALTIAAVGIVGMVLRETPTQVIAQAQSLLSQAQTAKAAATAMAATAQQVIDATTPVPAAPAPVVFVPAQIVPAILKPVEPSPPPQG